MVGPVVFMKNILSHYKFNALISIVIATVLFTQWGYFWYAMLLDDVWQSLIGKTELELIALAERRGLIQTINTYFISFVQAVGLFLLIKLARIHQLKNYLKLLALVPLFFIIPALGNAVLFAGQPFELWILDSVHFWAGYILMGAVYWICLEGPKFVRSARWNSSQKIGAIDLTNRNTQKL